MAFADAFRYVTDPDHMELDYWQLLSPTYGAQRGGPNGRTAQIYSHGIPPKSGTVYLCCADGEGNMVSYIQSNYMGFGSGIVVPGTGVSLQNRGHDFSLDSKDANCLKPASAATIPLSRAFCFAATARLWDPSGSWGPTCSPRATSRW